MDLTLNNAVMGVELSGIRQFTYLVRDTPGACALTIGEPDLNTPRRHQGGRQGRSGRQRYPLSPRQRLSLRAGGHLQIRG